jgi:hypothetical protein
LVRWLGAQFRGDLLHVRLFLELSHSERIPGLARNCRAASSMSPEDNRWYPLILMTVSPKQRGHDQDEAPHGGFVGGTDQGREIADRA